MIKRRTLEGSKARRPLRKHRIGETLNPSSAGTYFKVFLVWIIVLAIDYAVDFRIEFFWPLWLLIRTGFDSFRYQGVSFMVTFLFLVLLCDIICLFLLPNPWLLFAASNYVWVQLVWHSDQSIGVTPVVIWLLFVYIDATLRFRSTSPYLDFSRPFASQCIGYPVVSLGFGLKSYFEYKIQERRKEAVRKDNQFYYDLIQQALPKPEPVASENTKLTADDEMFANQTSRSWFGSLYGFFFGSTRLPSEPTPDQVISNGTLMTESEVITNHKPETLTDTKPNSVKVKQQPRVANASVAKVDTVASKSEVTAERISVKSSKKDEKSQPKVVATPAPSGFAPNAHNVDIPDGREITIRSLKADLEASKLCEEEAERRCIQLGNSEKALKQDNQRLKIENDNLSQKVSSLSSTKKQDQAEISLLEKRLRSEQEAHTSAEEYLQELKKQQPAEAELESIRYQLSRSEEKLKALSDETKHVETRKTQLLENSKKESEVLMSALTAMQDKNLQLEKSLSAETRIKLDLFSALGDAQRRLALVEGKLNMKIRECSSLEQRIAQYMAVLPPDLTSSDNDVS
eukprot:m.4478 g.4478  ORF g.4478 m.4478 type:complete len:572 (+) comp10815_c0_seq1:35-1750(+)